MISLNYVLNHFEEALNIGRTALRGEAVSLFEILLSIEVALAGLYVTLGSGGAQLAAAKRVLVIGFFLYVIRNYDTVLSSLIEGFIHAGEVAGGASGGSIATFHNPDAIIEQAYRISQPGWDKLMSLSGEGWFGLPSVDALIIMFCLFIAILAYFTIAIQAFVTYLEFLLISSVGLILVPFGVFKPTAFMAEKLFGAIVGFGIKLMVLAVVLAVTSTVMRELVLPDAVTWQNSLNFVLISLALAFLSWHAPATALSLLHGQPMLKAADVASSAVGASRSVVATRSAMNTTITQTQAAARAVGGAAALSAGVLSTGAGRGAALGRSLGSRLPEGSAASRLTSAAGTLGGGAAGMALGAVGEVAGRLQDRTVAPAVQHLSTHYASGKQSLAGRWPFNRRGGSQSLPPTRSEDSRNDKDRKR